MGEGKRPWRNPSFSDGHSDSHFTFRIPKSFGYAAAVAMLAASGYAGYNLVNRQAQAPQVYEKSENAKSKQDYAQKPKQALETINKDAFVAYIDQDAKNTDEFSRSAEMIIPASEFPKIVEDYLKNAASLRAEG